MKHVYGHGDIFPGKPWFRMDIWLNKHGRLFMRFWTRSRNIEDESFEINGIDPRTIPAPDKKRGFNDRWLPKVVRDEYENWVLLGGYE